ncbi:hypothetical protein RvY_18106 [Ramazzottius varieornatus]|uniref:protein-serine/threonine phosphatase n=1 Tax=Ramazzottius varieornatus TaxID=947166 RepID=A0A1D1W9W6_RAMVA|nr:hypothetical protein RvY_18106 [Ramazzottius varieornatus]
MGSYLSTPVTSKESENGSGRNGLLYGASAMQGWRVSQEDAHVTLPEFDDQSMLFAVFDGHGGSEVAKYAAMHLGQHLKSLDNYKKGNFQEALTEAFLSFDELLTQPHVLEVLRAIAKNSNDSDADSQTDDGNEVGEEDSDEEEEDGEDLAELLDEADAPIEELLANSSADQVRRLLSNKKLDLKGMLMKHLANMDDDEEDSEEEDDEEEGSTDDETGHSEESQSTVSKSSAKESGEAKKAEGDIVHPDTIVTQLTATEVRLDHLVADDQQVQKTANEEGSLPNGIITSSASEPEHPFNGMSKKVEEAGDDASSTVRIAGSAVGEGPSKEEVKPLRSVIIDDDQAAGPSTSSRFLDPDQPSSSSGLSSVLNLPPDDAENDKDYRPTEEADSDDEDDDDLDDEKVLKRLSPAGRRLLLPPGMFDFGESHTAVAGYDSGATACLAFIKKNVLYVANVGDSRCVVSQNGQAVDMSIDHKPDDPLETARINRAGGKVTSDGRVNNGLNLSRALGDHNYKRNEELDLSEQMISAKPDVRTLALNSSHDFMVIACDGIWNSMSSQQVVDFVKERLDKAIANNNLASICEELFSVVLAPNAGGDGTGMDNMTCIIVKLPAITAARDVPAAAESAKNGGMAVGPAEQIQIDGDSHVQQMGPHSLPMTNGNHKRTAEEAKLYSDPQGAADGQETTSAVKKAKLTDNGSSLSVL